MIRKAAGFVLVVAAITVTASSNAWCVPVATYTSLPPTWEKTSNPYVQNCTTHRTCHWTNTSVTQPTGMLIGTQAPSDWTLVGLEVLSPTLGPLVVGGTTITATQMVCGPGGCPVEALHPAPPGGTWFEFTTNDVPASNGSGSLDFAVRTTYDVGPLVNPEGRIVSEWMSDDGNARYGNTVVEDFSQGAFVFTDVSLTDPETALEFRRPYFSPNPALGSVRVVFALPQAARARVSVIDVAGRQVHGLADASFAAGAHELRWDGRDDSGNASAAGVYFVRIESGKSARVPRVTRLR